MVTVNIQGMYKCDTCKAASDEYGNGCKYGMLFPLLLFLTEKSKCENYEFDPEKANLQLKKKEEAGG